eukprot:TRINITY_DN28989_c0_g1_i1.p1 TRINITY_DN28989_c0_g1~~TRINITY_DN28989_c0_g1_i1.p1  ORF type:complete len:108 (+),score=5.63 TRINITY_DN28989_c0_g1_i1:100-423(+)
MSRNRREVTAIIVLLLLVTVSAQRRMMEKKGDLESERSRNVRNINVDDHHGRRSRRQSGVFENCLPKQRFHHRHPPPSGPSRFGNTHDVSETFAVLCDEIQDAVSPP